MNQQTNQFLQNKINQNSHFLNINQQQLAASRYIGMPNQNQFMPNTNLTSSPPLNGQFNAQNLIGQQQQQLQQNLNQNNFPMVSPNNMFLQQNNNNNNNSISQQLNFKNQMSQQQNIQQINNGQNLIASVIAANTTCSLNNTLFVGNLHASLQEIDLVQVFRPFGRIVECCKKWLHFGFVKFTSEEEACHAYVTLNGFRLKGRPMRLEFQNRTKKARIKAILAQAALQASSNGLNCNEGMESTLSNMGFPSFLNENSAHNQFGSISNNKSTFDQTNDCSFFNSDQLIKFANSIDITDSKMDLKKLADMTGQELTKQQEVLSQSNMNFSFNEKMLGKDLIESTQSDISSQFKKYISPSESPHHEFSCSLSSSDSGCRSTASFLAEEDSGIASFLTNKSGFTSANLLTIKKTKKHHDSCLTEENLSSFNEELNKKTNHKSSEDADENTEVLSVTDSEHDTDQTSDDASDIPDSECLLDDLASLDDLEDPFTMNCDMAKILNQVMDKDGEVLRKKLDYGIYRSVNQTMSLFIEPQDVLKKVDVNDYEEYSLFPNGMESVESYLCAMVM